jgi:hypothetical protein
MECLKHYQFNHLPCYGYYMRVMACTEHQTYLKKSQNRGSLAGIGYKFALISKKLNRYNKKLK